jgi:hypothetical protein
MWICKDEFLEKFLNVLKSFLVHISDESTYLLGQKGKSTESLPISEEIVENSRKTRAQFTILFNKMVSVHWCNVNIFTTILRPSWNKFKIAY